MKGTISLLLVLILLFFHAPSYSTTGPGVRALYAGTISSNDTDGAYLGSGLYLLNFIIGLEIQKIENESIGNVNIGAFKRLNNNHLIKYKFGYGSENAVSIIEYEYSQYRVYSNEAKGKNNFNITIGYQEYHSQDPFSGLRVSLGYTF